jgi:hypothetical protein
MKMYLYTSVFLLAMCNCTSDSETINTADHDIQSAHSKAKRLCNQNSMVWLSDMLNKAEEDRLNLIHKGNYIGTVSLIRYKDQPVVYTDFAMGSGGIAFYLFDCNGNPVSCEGDDAIGNIPNLAKENIIYSSLGE